MNHGLPEPDLVAAAAMQARDHAAKAAVTGIGPGTVEQLTAEVIRLSRSYVAGPPFPLFIAMHETLGRVQTALDQRAHPAQARDLNFLAGALCGLLANASLDLGREDAADDLARAAWTYGTIIDHGPLIGWARGTQALVAIWGHRYADAAQFAEDGLRRLSAGMGTARLQAIRARALAGHDDFAEARAALQAANQASAAERPDQLHNGIAGEFVFDTAKLRYYEALVMARAGYPTDAETAATAAVSLYQAAPNRARSYGCEALAHAQLAKARLMTGNVDTAAEAIADLLRLDPARRISSLREHVDTCRELLRSARSKALSRLSTARTLSLRAITIAALSMRTRAAFKCRSSSAARVRAWKDTTSAIETRHRPPLTTTPVSCSRRRRFVCMLGSALRYRWNRRCRSPASPKYTEASPPVHLETVDAGLVCRPWKDELSCIVQADVPDSAPPEADCNRLALDLVCARCCTVTARAFVHSGTLAQSRRRVASPARGEATLLAVHILHVIAMGRISADPGEGCVYVFAELDGDGFTRWVTAGQLPAAWPQSTSTGGAPVALTRSPITPPM